MITKLLFAHIGFSNIVCVNKVKAVIRPYLATGRRLTKEAKDRGTFIDATTGKQMKSLILMDDGSVVGCALNPKTVMSRFHADVLSEPLPNDLDD